MLKKSSKVTWPQTVAFGNTEDGDYESCMVIGLKQKGDYTILYLSGHANNTIAVNLSVEDVLDRFEKAERSLDRVATFTRDEMPMPSEAGQRMPDGSIFMGTSPSTSKPFVAAPEDMSLTMEWQEAVATAARASDLGHGDWRLPTVGELLVMFEHREKGALSKTFNASGEDHSNRYWSAEQDGSEFGVAMNGHDGGHGGYFKHRKCSVRLVRDATL